MRLLATLLIALPLSAAAAGPSYTLAQLVQEADRNNPDLAAGRAKVDVAVAGSRKAWAMLQPSVNIAGGYSRNSNEAVLLNANFSDVTVYSDFKPGADGGIQALLKPKQLIETVVQPYNQVAGQARVSMPLLVVPAFFGLKMADAGVLAANKGFSYGRDELAFGVAQAYFGTLGAKKVVELSRTQLETATTQERITKARLDSGQVPAFAMVRARAERVRAEAELRRAENMVSTAMLAISSVTGVALPFDIVDLPAVAAPARGADALVDQAMGARQDLASAETVVGITQNAIELAWWKIAPVVALTGTGQYTNFQGFIGANFTWVVQLGLNWNVYDATRGAELDEARAKAAEAEANVLAVRARITNEVRSALLDVENAKANVEKAREQAKLGEEAATLTAAAFQAGTATYLDVVDANTMRFAAGIGAVAEELNVQLATLKLLKSMGDLRSVLPVK